MTKLYQLLAALLLGLAARAAQAQASPATPVQGTDSVRQAIDYLFAPVDKSQVPVACLFEYGNQFAAPQPYDGTLTSASVVTLPAWRMLYASVLGGNVGRASSLPALPALNDALAAQVAATPAAIPLVVQCLDYASLRPDAIAAGLLTYSGGQLYDVPGRAASPYEVRKLFAVAPARPVAATGSVSFVFQPGLHVSAAGAGAGSVQAIQLDFGDGRGYQPVAWNVPIGTQYCAAGSQRIKVRISYGSGPVAGPDGRARVAPVVVAYESWFDLYVQEADCNAARYTQEKFYPFKATSEHSGGGVFVRFGGQRAAGDIAIRRPLIVAEGYDPHSVAPAASGGNYGVGDFLKDIRKTDFYDNLENAVDALGNPSGYDIIFIDYNNGTDDIRRNAALFEEVVRWVNKVKVGGRTTGAENVVLGVSMGGLVARYGLAEMVKNPLIENGVNINDPHTRLLVTHDSPHRGANTPLGIQMLVRQAAGSLAGTTVRAYNSSAVPYLFPVLALVPELQQADDLLEAPATRQLLLLRGRRYGFGALAYYDSEYNSFLDGDYRTMITPASGQAFPYRFIASSLGSQCGQGLFAPHAELIRIERSGYAGIVGLTAGYGLQTIVNALPPAGQVQPVSLLRLWAELKVLGYALPRVYLTNRVFAAPASNPVAWDGLPGGTQAVSGQLSGLRPGGTATANIVMVFVAYGGASNTYLADQFCFVPRASALDVQTLDYPSLNAPYINGVPGGSASRAEKFIAQERYVTGVVKFNAEHPAFPARQARWLFNEMQGPYNGNANPAACDALPECSPVVGNAIAGPSTLCVDRSANPGATATYTSPLQAPGYTYSWTATSPGYPPCGAFTVCTGTSPTFQTANVPGVNDTGTIRLEVTTACQTFVYTKDVVISAPSQPDVELDAQNSGLCQGVAKFVIKNYSSALSYAYAVQDGTLTTHPGGTFTIKGAADATAAYTVTVSSAGNCGSASASGTVYFPICRQAYTVYPNPANDDVAVAQQDSSASRGRGAKGTGPGFTPFVVRLYDGYGLLRQQAAATGPVLHLGLVPLPPGYYLLAVVVGGVVVERHRLQVAR